MSARPRNRLTRTQYPSASTWRTIVRMLGRRGLYSISICAPRGSKSVRVRLALGIPCMNCLRLSLTTKNLSVYNVECMYGTLLTKFSDKISPSHSTTHCDDVCSHLTPCRKIKNHAATSCGRDDGGPAAATPLRRRILRQPPSVIREDAVGGGLPSSAVPAE